jgi:hypothetical protein
MKDSPALALGVAVLLSELAAFFFAQAFELVGIERRIHAKLRRVGGFCGGLGFGNLGLGFAGPGARGRPLTFSRPFGPAACARPLSFQGPGARGRPLLLDF